MAAIEITAREFDDLRRYIHTICGLHIQEDKKYLVQQRLEKLLQMYDCSSFGQYYEMLTSAPTREMREQIIAAITTNETSFFRDGHPYDTFRKHLLPKLCAEMRAEGRTEPIRIWSAASSTGQEPYSLAICLMEEMRRGCAYGLGPELFTILATDISDGVLSRAKTGSYNEVEMSRGVPEELRGAYFSCTGREWRVCDEVRSMVEFRKMNLLEPFGIYTPFDVIFCRNVLIYFDDETKRRIVEGFHYKLCDNGALVLGSAENLYGITSRFQSELIDQTLVYRKVLCKR